MVDASETSSGMPMTTPSPCDRAACRPDPFLALESWRVGIAMLTMEEDEVADGGFPSVLDEETGDCELV